MLVNCTCQMWAYINERYTSWKTPGPSIEFHRIPRNQPCFLILSVDWINLQRKVDQRAKFYVPCGICGSHSKLWCTLSPASVAVSCTNLFSLFWYWKEAGDQFEMSHCVRSLPTAGLMSWVTVISILEYLFFMHPVSTDVSFMPGP